MKQEIKIPVSEDQEIILSTLGKSKNQFSIWLCQGTYNESTEEYATQFHISTMELDEWISKLQEIKQKKQEYLEQIHKTPAKDIVQEIFESIEAFQKVTGCRPNKICVNEVILDTLLNFCVGAINVNPAEKQQYIKDKKRQIPLELFLYGIPVVRKFDEITKAPGYILE